MFGHTLANSGRSADHEAELAQHDCQTNLDAAQMIGQIRDLTNDIHRSLTAPPSQPGA